MRQVSFLLILALSLCCVETTKAQDKKSNIRHSFFVAGPVMTGIVSEEGKVLWDSGRKGARDGFVLSNGNILIAWSNEVKEFTRDKEVVFTYTKAAENKEIGTAARLENGNTLITELGAKPRLMEVTPDGKIAVEVALKPETDNAHMQTRMARKLDNGNYLVPHLLAFAVKEYTPEGKVVNKFATDTKRLGKREAENWPFTAIRLEKGNTVIGCTHGNRVIEVNAKGKIVWQVTNDDVNGIIDDACGVQRLANGNTVITSYHATEGVKLFEVNKKREVVWTYTGPYRAHHFQILTTNGKPEASPPLK